MIEEKCICRHERRAHANRPFGTDYIPKSDCFFVVKSGALCKCLLFQLDNLKLIEDLAKERTLI
jgi:hypothetical protein